MIREFIKRSTSTETLRERAMQAKENENKKGAKKRSLEMQSITMINKQQKKRKEEAPVVVEKEEEICLA